MLECFLGTILIDFGLQNRPRLQHHSRENPGRGRPSSSWRRSFVFLSLLASLWEPLRPFRPLPDPSKIHPNLPAADFGSFFDQFTVLAGIKKQAKSLEGYSFLDFSCFSIWLFSGVHFRSIFDRSGIVLGSIMFDFGTQNRSPPVHHSG